MGAYSVQCPQLMTTALSVCMRVIIIYTVLEPWVKVVVLAC